MMLDERDLDFELMTDESSAWPWRTHAFRRWPPLGLASLPREGVVFLEIRKRRWEVSWTPPEALLLSYG